MATKFNTRYSHKRFEGDGIEFKEASLTEQQFAFETDINNIVKGFVTSTVNDKKPLFNLEISPDMYNDALNIIADASSQFENLPVSIRTEFDNDPQKLLAFVQDDKNYDRAVELGLIEKKVTPSIKPQPLPSTVTTVAPAPVVTEVSSQ
ncbi:internal scaffolding protein [Dipodfec virus UOA04_Rod_760]|nr:internal scaffolding protein [Dipodfec virus UOA04_Rod_760]